MTPLSQDQEPSTTATTSNQETFPFKTEAYIARTHALETQPLPLLEPITYTSLAPNHLLVRIAAASICHTDVRAITNDFYVKGSLIAGHEGSGTVLATGSAVTYVKPGDNVVLAYASCGECTKCLQGRKPYCRQTFPLNFAESPQGLVRDAEGANVNGLFFAQSSFSRVALVDERSCVKVDVKSKEDLQACATLGCGIMTGFGAVVNVAKPPADSSIVVFGGGSVGLAVILAAKLYGPAALILVDNSATKLGLIDPSILTGVQVVNSSSHKDIFETSAAIKALTPTGLGADFAFDCVGNTKCTHAAHECLDTDGTVINIGSSSTQKIEILLNRHMTRGIKIHGTLFGDSASRIAVPQMMNLWRRGQFPFDKMIKRYKFEELEKALDEMHHGKVVKPLLVL